MSSLAVGASLDLTISALSPLGHGVADWEGLRIEVAGATVGDHVHAKITAISQHKPTAWADAIAFVHRGETFVTPACPHAAPLGGRCGGCPLSHLVEDAQLVLLAENVATELGDVWTTPIAIRSLGPRTGYRVRSNYVVHEGRLGSWAPRSHELADMEGCGIVRPAITNTARHIQRLLTGTSFAEGELLRYVTIRASSAGDVLVEWIAQDASAPWVVPLTEQVMAIDEVVGVSISVNTSSGNAIRTGPSAQVAGRETVDEQIGAIVLETSAAAFTQLNSQVAAEMYQTAARWMLDAMNGDVVWDLYCGLGGLALTLAATSDVRVFGAESHDLAVRLARTAADRNRLGDRATFAAADLRETWPDGWPPPAGVFVNPPRRGLDALARARLVALQVPTVYMSCSPRTFARDVRAMGEAGFVLQSLEAWDMLPQTTHVELLGLLVPQNMRSAQQRNPIS